ncbi:MAG: hypothetical protein IKO93_03990, partial [Lentisphaeria bacterium]|nr:hypothetical protein [Lentisphaeria bacterium]
MLFMVCLLPAPPVSPIQFLFSALRFFSAGQVSQTLQFYSMPPVSPIQPVSPIPPVVGIHRCAGEFLRNFGRIFIKLFNGDDHAAGWCPAGEIEIRPETGYHDPFFGVVG